MQKVLIADNRCFNNAGLAQYLYSKMKYQVIGLENEEESLLEICQKGNIDILFLRDWWDCTEQGFATISQLKSMLPNIKVILLVNNYLRAFIYFDNKMPIDGYLWCDAKPKDVEECLACIGKGERYLSFMTKTWGPLKCNFTVKELKVLSLVVQGKTYEEIGQELNITRRGAIFHTTKMLKNSGHKKLMDIIVEALQ